MSEKYSGWTNRATWVVAACINNDEVLWEWAADLLLDDECDVEQFGECLQAWWHDFEQKLIDSPMELTRNMRMALWDVGSSKDVNWNEIVTSLLDGRDV